MQRLQQAARSQQRQSVKERLSVKKPTRKEWIPKNRPPVNLLDLIQESAAEEKKLKSWSDNQLNPVGKQLLVKALGPKRSEERGR